MAYNAAPPQRRGNGELVAGILLGLVLTALVAMATIWAIGALSGPSATFAEPPVVTSDDMAEARPTAAWPFRKEWLTPRPKS